MLINCPRFDIGGSLATNKGKFKVPGPNLRDRISSLRTYGLSLDGLDLDDGHTMGSGSGMSIASGSGATYPPPPYQPAGLGFGLSTGPEIPWATRPDMDEYHAAKAAAAQSTTSGGVPTGATASQAITDPADTTAATPTLEAEASHIEDITTDAARTVVAQAEVAHIEDVMTEGDQTDVANTDNATIEVISAGSVTADVVSSEFPAAEVVSAFVSAEVSAGPISAGGAITRGDAVIAGGATTELLSTVGVPSEVLSTVIIPTGVLSPEVASTGVIPTNTHPTTITGTEVTPSGLVIAGTEFPTTATALKDRAVTATTTLVETDSVQQVLPATAPTTDAAAAGEIGAAEAVTDDPATATE